MRIIGTWKYNNNDRIDNINMEPWFERCGILSNAMKNILRKIVAYNEHYICCKTSDQELVILTYTKNGISNIPFRTLYFHNILDVQATNGALYVSVKESNDKYRLYLMRGTFEPRGVFQSCFEFDIHSYDGSEFVYIVVSGYNASSLLAYSPVDFYVTMIEHETLNVIPSENALYYVTHDYQTEGDALYSVTGCDTTYLISDGGNRIQTIIDNGKYMIISDGDHHDSIVHITNETKDTLGYRIRSAVQYDKKNNAIYYTTVEDQVVKHTIGGTSEIVAKGVKDFIVNVDNGQLHTTNDSQISFYIIEVPDIDAPKSLIIGFADLDIILTR